MESRQRHWVRWLLTALVAVACAMFAQVPVNAAAAPLSISVSGNHFVNGSGQTVRLLGVNHPSFEYACVDGYAYDDGKMDAADAAAIASWHATAVRVPLNEDCWLGINGQPNSSAGASPPLTKAGYRQAVESYVSALTAAGLYVILDLHWSAPGTVVADGQRPMPDEHSGAFWSSVASTFKEDHGVVFDAFNEPFSPATNGDTGFGVDWDCWRNGSENQNCFLPTSKDGDPPDNNSLYSPVGMQYLVNQIRATGATQPILLGGLDYANDLTQWLASEPNDPLGQLAASFHNYQGKNCDNASCWNTTIASVAAQVPVVTGEFDQDVCTPSTFDSDYMNWADAHGVSYLAWGWWVLSPQEISADGCSAYYLITDPSGTPAAPNGTVLHDHLAALAGGGTPTTTTTTPTAATVNGLGNGAQSHPRPGLSSFKVHVKPDGSAVNFVLLSAQSCSGTLTGKTASAFATSASTAKHRRHAVLLGTAQFTLSAGKAKAVVLELSKQSRALLVRKHSLEVQITITLSGAQSPRVVIHRIVTLRVPAKRKHKG
jgi:endoglucanase